MIPSRPTGWIRFAINAEKPILSDCSALYDGISIPAHVFALYRNSIGQSISQWGKPYFIDPMTYVFLLSRDIVRTDGGSRLRKSYEKLCEYDKRAKYYFDLDKLNPATMSNVERTDFADTIGHLTAEIQLGGISATGPPKRVKSLQRIQKHMSSGKTESYPPPSFLVSPYFFFESVGDATYELWKISVKAFEKYISKKNAQLPVYRAICTGEETLRSPTDITAMMKDLVGSDGVVLWISDFENLNLDNVLLEGFGNLVKGINEKVGNVISLYGGYLTALYYHFGLDGLSFGLSYGDKKEVSAYATGGGAPSRYYDPNLHTFITAQEAVVFYGRSLNHGKLFTCNCPVCDTTSKSLQQETQDDKALKHLRGVFKFKGKAKATADWSKMREHFLYVRKRELEDIGSKGLGALANQASNNLSMMGGSGDSRLKTLEKAVDLSNIGP